MPREAKDISILLTTLPWRILRFDFNLVISYTTIDKDAEK